MTNTSSLSRPQEVIIFIVGGTTYEESRSVALQNASNSGIRFILGGSVVLYSKRFLKDLEEAQRVARSSTAVVWSLSYLASWEPFCGFIQVSYLVTGSGKIVNEHWREELDEGPSESSHLSCIRHIQYSPICIGIMSE
jgi:hypothetical protein